jgi:hypothetical protein
VHKGLPGRAVRQGNKAAGPVAKLDLNVNVFLEKKGVCTMEQGNFETRKAEILKRIGEALTQGDSQTLYIYSQIFRDLENEYRRDFSRNDPRSLIVDFSVS